MVTRSKIFDIIARAAASDVRKRYHIRAVLSEAFNNAYLHGENSSNNACIEMEACFNKDIFFVSIINEGKGFADSIPQENGFQINYAESGRGLKIIKMLSKRVEFKKVNENKFGVFIEIDVSSRKKYGKKRIDDLYQPSTPFPAFTNVNFP